jgi:glycosyltransferase involved in cell wall biosynthesis
MKILMSAFACSPVRGSEEGVGWNWAVQAAKQGHEVTVITQTCDQADIEASISNGDVPAGLNFEFLMPDWLALFRKLTWKAGLRGFSDHLTHVLWQFCAYNHVHKRHKNSGFEIVHHITYGGIRHPTLMGFLPFPLILGPLGGGDQIPMTLRRRFGWLSWVRELVRDIHTLALRFDPITLHACSRARVIYVKTLASKHVLPKRFHDKTVVRMEIGIHHVVQPLPAPEHKSSDLRLIYAGRFLDIKGMRLGIMALAAARSKGVHARLTMVGPGGPDETAWRQLAKQLGINDAIDWLGWTTKPELNKLYQSHDALLFPSLRDSSGNVVLESLASGLPVICLNLGGPAELVNKTCGLIVPVDSANNQFCIDRLAAAIVKLGSDRKLLEHLSSGALDQAGKYLWPNVVSEFYTEVQGRLLKEPSPRSGSAREVLNSFRQLLSRWLGSTPVGTTGRTGEGEKQ